MNFIYNNFDSNNTFHDVLKKLVYKVLQRPDWKLTSRIDVAEKIHSFNFMAWLQMEIELFANVDRCRRMYSGF
jgi:aspartokinase/homoserine dehydrogenase 1